VKNQEVRAKICRNLPRLEYKKYSYLVAAPLDKTDFEPQIIIIYGNPAQISRLVQSEVYATGNTVASESGGAFACCAEVTVPMLMNKCQMVLTGGGDRVIAQTQDREVAFAIPSSKIDSIVEGLEQTHKAGMRYPAPSFLLYQAQFPPDFGQLMDYLRG